MKTTTITCDICNQTIPTAPGWEEMVSPLLIKTYCRSQNPMAQITGKDFQANTFAVDEVCQDCQRAIAETIAAKIEELQCNGKREDAVAEGGK